ncbi:protein madd-4-like isoform X3 [Cherax quadricarinatus]|uniref:protein madd-4-like isoform X3 n=1 Tax=Cherax quadricarinatus TaxID=27406 RepID=UPI00387E8705
MRKMSKPRTHYSLLTLAALVLVVSATDQLPDLQQQQQQQQHTLNDPEDGWSPWSSWSLCSRSCDGGAAVQTRRCRHYTGCRGDSVRYQLCNTEPCPAGSKDFRAVQCSEYNGLPYEGTLYEWEPAGGADPCALTCRAVGGGPTVTLNPRVQDGTRCSPESFNLCINGRCQRVGCDHKLGSEKKVDQCGVCGGDGASCQQPSHSWETRANSACSATCGGGYQMLSAVCVETETGRRVDDEHCQPADRPITVILNCNDHACPTSWQTGEWGSCSVSCGSGYQLREVYCEEPRNISSVRVADHYCVLPRPPHRQPCNTYECPRWYDGIWSQCSATCGEGVQTRVVLCRDAQGRSSRLCHQGLRPAHTRPCRTGVTCPPPTTLAHPRHQPYTPPWWSEEQDALASEEGLAPPLIPRPQALIVDQQVPSEPTYMKGNWSSCSVTCGEGSRSRSVTCKIFLEFSRTVAVLPDDQCPGAKPPHSQRCVLPPCSHAMTRHEYPASEVSDAAHEHPIVSLEDAHDEDDSNGDQKIHETPFLPKLVDEDASFGRGKTLVQDIDLQVPKAQAYNEPHPGLHSYETPTDLQPASDPLLRYASEFDAHNQYDSYEVSRSKPQLESEHAEMNSIEIDMGGGEGGYPGSYQIEDESNIAHTYQWTTLGFGPCSASCLGGVQESMVKCVRKSDRKPVISQLCSTLVRPDIITRTCNDQPCPPRWNISEFGECSKTCGGGIQTREVKCIHEVTRGGTNTVEVPDSLCPQPPHRTQQHCNFMDCPPEWVPSRWSKCSAPCGGGGKRREVRCHQALANGRIEERPNRECPHRQPRSFRKCNQRGCQGERKEPKNSIIKSQVHQNYVQSKFMKRLTLKVGGTATVFRGVKVKVKCPVRRFDRSKITWWYEGHQVGKRGPIRTNNNGVLKIKEVQYPHAGVYICRANTSEANITLEVKPLPSSYPSSEELHQSSGSSVNEVSLHNFEDTTGTLRGYEWLPNKSTKLQGNGGRRRKGRRRSKTLKNKGRGGRRRKGNWESNWSPSDNKTSWTMHTTFRPILTFPSSSGTLGEGPFKASSKNMHTVEMTSSEATNTFDPTYWHSNTHTRKPEQEYIYGTVKHSGWPLHSEKGYHTHTGWDQERDLYGTTNHLPEKDIDEERQHVFGRVTHHSDGSRITSEESHIFGTIRYGPLPETTEIANSGRAGWSDMTSITETHLPERNPVFEENGNSLEDGLSGLETESKFSPDNSDPEKKHRHHSFLRSGQRLGSWSNRGESLNSDRSTGRWPNQGTSSPIWDMGTSTSTTTNNPHLWHSLTNPLDQQHHKHQQYDLPGTPHSHVEAFPSLPPAPPNTSSGASRSVPYFQKILSHLESFLPTSLQRTISSRGGRHAASPRDEFGGLISHDLLRDATTTEHPLGTPEILGKGTRDSLEFEWQMTNWSECSQTCGFTSSSSGYQVRSIQCLVRVNNVSRPVDGALCVDAGLEAPVTIQRCGLTECPQWHFGEWSECESSRCFTLHYAFQRRDVVCRLHNGTVVSASQCDDRTRPRHRQECYNYQCSGVWRVGEWSECTAPCGGQGYRTRLLQCVWNGTKKAAGNACRELPRPEVVRWCDGEPCPDLSM